MNWFTYLIYALTAIAVCFLAVSLNKRLEVKRDKRFYDFSKKETKLLRLYENLEDMMESFELYVEDSKKALEQERQHLSQLVQHTQNMALNINAQLNHVEHDIEKNTPVSAVPANTNGIGIHKDALNAYQRTMETSASAPANSEPPESEKFKPRKVKRNEKIINLHNHGLTVEEIAKELNIAQGEIILVLGMEKN